MDDDCTYCFGKGMDPVNDYLLPCPRCGGTGGELLGHDDDWDGCDDEEE